MYLRNFFFSFIFLVIRTIYTPHMYVRVCEFCQRSIVCLCNGMRTHLPPTEGSTNEILSFVTYGVYFSNLILMMYTCRYSTGLWHASLFSAAIERRGEERIGLGSRVHVRIWLTLFTKHLVVENNYFRIISDVCVKSFQPMQIGGC